MRAVVPIACVVALAAITAFTLSACSRSAGSQAATESTATPLAADSAKKGRRTSGTTAVLDLVRDFDACSLGHRGTLLDLGDATMRARMSGGKLATAEVELRERDGATWVSVHGRTLELSFVSPTDVRTDNGVVIEARVRGGAAKSVATYLDGKLIGTLPLAKGETKVVQARSVGATIARGPNELLLRFAGGPRAAKDELAEIDWIRVGPADGDAAYAAPTRSDAIASATLGGITRRGLSLRAPGWARCSSFIPNGAVLEGFVGVTGGEAEAEVRVLVDRAEPRVAGSVHVGGTETIAWRPLSIPLGDVGTLAAVELVAKSSSKGARVFFAEPRVVVASNEPPPAPAASRGVILVVMSSLPRKSLATYGGVLPVPELGALAARGSTFETHRASTSLASGAMASMLTGLGPREHAVADPDAALPAGVTTIAEAARQGGVVTAMFTANPTTGAAYGFSRGWETFVARSPAEEASPTAIFDDVAHWLDGHKTDRFLVVVHARGGHPPWDATSDELKAMPPAGYNGGIDPRHAAEVLAKTKRAGAGRTLSDADRERVFALHAKAVGAHDAALGKLVSHVTTLGRDADVTWIVTSDVGVDPGAHVPFLEDDGLDEGALSLPLVVRNPHATGDSALRPRVAVPTGSADVARTALEALGLPPPRDMRGKSLWASTHAQEGASERASIAATGTRFSTRWAGFVLLGARDREVKLCNLALEAECVTDVRATHPLAAEILHGVAFDELAGQKRMAPVARSVPDPAGAAALRAWGR